MRAPAALAVLGFAVLGGGAGCPKPLPAEPRRPLFVDGADGASGAGVPGSAAAPAPSPSRPRTPEPAPGQGARTVDDGVVVETLVPGAGDPPLPNDRVTLRSTRWAPDAPFEDAPERQFDTRRLPFGLAQAVATMRVGERARAWVPAVTTTGADTAPIIVDLELRSIQVAPPTPPDVAAPAAQATTAANGVASLVLEPGTGGPKPGAADEVVVIYSSWYGDGSMIETTTWDYSPTRTWTVNRFNAGLASVLGEMTAGEKRRAWVPIKLTEFNDGTDDPERIVYDVELVELHARAPMPKTPKDVRKPPASAKRTPKGVRYKFLARGKGTTHPGPTSVVRAHYSGWTTDGRMFDSSVTRGTPGTFGLDQVIKGWTDVVPVMVTGDKLRAWIPAALAYGDQPGMPAGMLVFDIELLEIVR